MVEPRRTKYWAHSPHPTQQAFLLLEQREALFGGAAGGGKSDALLMAALQYVDVPGYSAVLFRRTFADLSKPEALMDRAREWLAPSDAVWNEQRHAWRFPSGAVLQFAHLETENSKYDHQGAAYQFIGFDELTQFSLTQYTYLFSRLRRLQGVLVPLRMRGASNPGGIGHEWVLNRFLIQGPAHGRPFVPSKLEDNPSLDREEYERSLAELDPVTRAQLRWGDWGVRDRSNALVPEWTKEIAAASVKVVSHPEYFQPYVVGDLGSRDLTVWLFGWHWFEEDLEVIEDELVLANPSTAEMIAGIKAKEFELWGLRPINRPKRFSDVDWRLVKDFAEAKLKLVPTKKDDSLGARNKTRTQIGGKRILINPRCRTLILTLETGRWNDKRTDYLRTEGTGHADAWDALVYFDRNVARRQSPKPVVAPIVIGQSVRPPEKPKPVLSKGAGVYVSAFKRR